MVGAGVRVPREDVVTCLQDCRGANVVGAPTILIHFGFVACVVTFYTHR